MSSPSTKDAPVEPAPASVSRSGEVDPLVGRVISDRFRVISPIARGGMGVVYKAEQAPLGRIVAIKVLSLKQDEEKDPEFRRRFFLEAATVAKLTHPNTVTVFDYGQGDGGVYYIAMEYVDGRTLKKALNVDGPFDAARAINVAKQICRSLREAHRLGVIHRDMKPGNVMLVDRDGEDYVKVLDFGLVKEVNPEDPDEDLTQAGVFMGSPKYMAPEQIQGERVDGRTDIYSIGVMLYEMLCGRVPFNRDNPMQILMDHVREPVPAMHAPDGAAPIPPELQAIVHKCLEKKMEDRFADMEALLVALKTGGVQVGLSMSSSSRMLPITGSGEIDVSGFPGGTPVSGVHTLDTSPSGGVAPVGSVSMPPDEAPRRGSGPLVAAAILLVGVLGIGGWWWTTQPSAVIDGAEASAVPPPLPGPETTPEPPPEATGALEAPLPVEEVVIRTVLLRIDSSPSGASVSIGDRDYGVTPTQVELVGDDAAEGREVQIQFARSGFRTTTLTETIRGDELEVSARLARMGRSGGSSSSGSSTASGSGSGSGGVETRVEGYRDSPY